MNKTLKLLDLFSGIGGFSYGFERTNRIKTIAFCEKDQFCKSVLSKHWSNTKIYNDVRDIKGSEIQADIVTGGFPCQPFSIAGKRRGKDDDRYLWDETLRVVAETKPRWFVGENVEGIINIANGSVLQQIQKDLEAESFQVQCLVIPASGIGAWHQRKRVWIIGCNISNSNISAETKRRQHEIDEKTSPSRTNNKRGGISNGRQRCVQSTWQSEDLYNTNSNLRGKSWWQTQSELCGVPDGVSTELHKDRQNRIKALGNSIVPEIAYLIGKSIVAAEYEK